MAQTQSTVKRSHGSVTDSSFSPHVMTESTYSDEGSPSKHQRTDEVENSCFITDTVGSQIFCKIISRPLLNDVILRKTGEVHCLESKDAEYSVLQRTDVVKSSSVTDSAVLSSENRTVLQVHCNVIPNESTRHTQWLKAFDDVKQQESPHCVRENDVVMESSPLCHVESWRPAIPLQCVQAESDVTTQEGHADVTNVEPVRTTSSHDVGRPGQNPKLYESCKTTVVSSHFISLTCDDDKMAHDATWGNVTSDLAKSDVTLPTVASSALMTQTNETDSAPQHKIVDENCKHLPGLFSRGSGHAHSSCFRIRPLNYVPYREIVQNSTDKSDAQSASDNEDDDEDVFLYAALAQDSPTYSFDLKEKRETASGKVKEVEESFASFAARSLAAFSNYDAGKVLDSQYRAMTRLNQKKYGKLQLSESV